MHILPTQRIPLNKIQVLSEILEGRLYDLKTIVRIMVTVGEDHNQTGRWYYDIDVKSGCTWKAKIDPRQSKGTKDVTETLRQMECRMNDVLQRYDLFMDILTCDFIEEMKKTTNPEYVLTTDDLLAAQCKEAVSITRHHLYTKYKIRTISRASKGIAVGGAKHKLIDIQLLTQSINPEIELWLSQMDFKRTHICGRPFEYYQIIE